MSPRTCHQRRPQRRDGQDTRMLQCRIWTPHTLQGDPQQPPPMSMHTVSSEHWWDAPSWLGGTMSGLWGQT